MKLDSAVVRVGNSAGKENDDSIEVTGWWVKLRSMVARCYFPKSKSKVEIVTPTSGPTSTQFEKSKSTNDRCNGQPIVPFASSSNTSNIGSTSSTSNISEQLKTSSHLRQFTYEELKSATRNFRPESLLGQGGFGCVFKGWINENGSTPVKPGTGLTVAVKILNHSGLQGHKEWLAEVTFLSDLLHPNLVKLIGYCVEDDQRLLVYEFLPRGSVENHLFRRSLPLPWPVRMRIALGAAKGLAFLHEEAERPVIYRDFKTSNILLDANYNAKLSDFGLAKDAPEGDATHVSTRVMGTYGYAAPEYVMTDFIVRLCNWIVQASLTQTNFGLWISSKNFVAQLELEIGVWISGHLTSKSDVYSFGVVLLEMLTGRRSMDKSRPNGEHNLVEWARWYLRDKRRFYEIIDPRLAGRFSIKGAQKTTQLVVQCLNRDPKARPLMSEVVEALRPLPDLVDMACASAYFHAMQAEQIRSISNVRIGPRTPPPPLRN